MLDSMKQHEVALVLPLMYKLSINIGTSFLQNSDLPKNYEMQIKLKIG